MIGEIVTQADLRSIAAENAKSISQTAFVAPTVFKVQGVKLPRVNYYATKEAAFNQFLFLTNKTKTKSLPSGSVDFTPYFVAQPIGINVDFYYYTPLGFVQLPYSFFRTMPIKAKSGIVFRFYKNDGSGPYYAIFDNVNFGASATVVKDIPANKIAALDEFHRQLQALKARHNTLAAYLTNISTQRLNVVQQQSYNEGLLLLQNLREEMKAVKGAEFSFGSKGEAIGIIPIIIWVVGAIVLAIAAAWTIDKVNTEIQKTKRLNAGYDIQKWLADQNLKIAAAKKAGIISEADAHALTQANTVTSNQAAENNTKQTEETKSVFDKIENIALIGLGILVVSKFVK
jgi:hypothetical protein